MKIPYKWVLRSPNGTVNIEELSSKFNLPHNIIKILINRGYDTEDKIKKFITNEIIYLENPFLFKDMSKAVEIIKRHIEENNPILIWGDKDIDGVSSLCVIYKALKIYGVEPLWYIPQQEGYGLNKEVLEKFKEKIKLLVTVDCGISSLEEVKYLKENNIDVIITDHHEPQEEILKEFKKLDIPIINPHLEEYKGFKDLAGVGVALKVAMALIMSYDKDIYNKEFIVLDIETTGLSSIFDEICEIAAVKIVNFIPKETFSTLIKTKNPIPASATKIHGITDDMLKDAKELEVVLREFLDFIGDATLIVHNSEFDITFINTALKKFGFDTLKNKVIDTLELSKEFFPFRSHSLEALCEDFMFKNKPKHRALDDVLATCELFYYLYYIKNSKIKIFIEDLLQFACLGTIGDVVSLIEDNRIIVKKGIQKFFSSNNPAIKRLYNFLKEKNTQQITAESIAWDIIPLLNSAGRLQQVEILVDFLLSEKETQAEENFQKLLELNSKRKILQNFNLSIFYELIEKQCNLKEDIVLLVVAENIEHGVTGIIANHMIREFNRPVILLISEGETATGAVRSPKGINIYEFLLNFRHLFEKFGGHENACGLTIKKENIETLRKEIKKFEKNLVITPPTLEIDLVLDPKDLNLELYKYINLLEPCGSENPYPVFLLKNLKVEDWKYIKNTKVTSIKFSSNMHKSIDAICFDIPDLADILRNFHYFNVVGELEYNDYTKDVRFVVLDLQPIV